MELSGFKYIFRKPISPFCVPLLILYFIYFACWIMYCMLSRTFLRNCMDGDKGERERRTRNKIQIWIYKLDGTLIAAWCVSEKKKYIKIKEIKWRLREKRINEVLERRKKKEREKERKRGKRYRSLDNCRPFSLSNIWNTRSRVTSSRKNFSYRARKYERAAPRRAGVRKSYLILHKIQGATSALTFSYTASRFHYA